MPSVRPGVVTGVQPAQHSPVHTLHSLPCSGHGMWPPFHSRVDRSAREVCQDRRASLCSHPTLPVCRCDALQHTCHRTSVRSEQIVWVPNAMPASNLAVDWIAVHFPLHLSQPVLAVTALCSPESAMQPLLYRMPLQGVFAEELFIPSYPHM